MRFEVAGPRERIYFPTVKTTVGIVRCGGVSPSLNNIIRGIVNQCHYRYHLNRIFGFRYGYESLVDKYGHCPMSLKPDSVAQIHQFGGSILGISRGHQDIGQSVDRLEEMKIDIFLRDKINTFFKDRKMPVSLKYIDPSYIVRSVPANAQGNVYCSQLAHTPSTPGMAGKTGMLVGRWHGTFVHLPLDLVTGGRRKVGPASELWNAVLETTGQPARLY